MIQSPGPRWATFGPRIRDSTIGRFLDGFWMRPPTAGQVSRGQRVERCAGGVGERRGRRQPLEPRKLRQHGDRHREHEGERHAGQWAAPSKTSTTVFEQIYMTIVINPRSGSHTNKLPRTFPSQMFFQNVSDNKSKQTIKTIKTNNSLVHNHGR